jgi:hypothetical protein
MLVPLISGSDKTTVSAATGHQEYHPVYQSPGNVTNIARRAHGNSVLPVAFLPIPKSEHLISSSLLSLIVPSLQQTNAKESDLNFNALHGRCTTCV